MSSVTLLLIIFSHSISQTINSNQCDFLTSFDLQSATYSHSLILHVQPFNSSEDMVEVLVREVIKMPQLSYHSIKIDDLVIIRIDQDLDDSCWSILRMENLDLILFLNETNTDEFNLRSPPVEVTFRVRQNIDAVINYDTYAPQVLIKTRTTKPILRHNYSLQCNARGNPIPRLRWSKNNEILEYYSSAKLCKTSSRIYSIQHKYQSTLHFQSLIPTDSGVYVCHAENAINHTMISVPINIDQATENVTCDNLKFCHHRGRCIDIDKQLKCLLPGHFLVLIRCDDRYFGEQCETNYDEMIKQQNNAVHLLKSRFLAGCILLVIGFLLILVICAACSLARKEQTKRKESLMAQVIPNGKMEQPFSPSAVQIVTEGSAIPRTNARELFHKRSLSS